MGQADRHVMAGERSCSSQDDLALAGQRSRQGEQALTVKDAAGPDWVCQTLWEFHRLPKGERPPSWSVPVITLKAEHSCRGCT